MLQSCNVISNSLLNGPQMSGKGQAQPSTNQGGQYKGTGDKADLNNHGNQGNTNHGEYKGYTGSYTVSLIFLMGSPFFRSLFAAPSTQH